MSQRTGTRAEKHRQCCGRLRRLRKHRPRLFYSGFAACSLLLLACIAAIIIGVIAFRGTAGVSTLPDISPEVTALTGCTQDSVEPRCTQMAFAVDLAYGAVRGSAELLEQELFPAISSWCTMGLFNRPCSSCTDSLRALNGQARLVRSAFDRVINVTQLDGNTVRVEYVVSAKSLLYKGTSYQQLTIGWGSSSGLIEYLAVCSDWVPGKFGEEAEAQRIADAPPAGTGGTYSEDGVQMLCPSWRCVHEDGWGAGERYPFTTTPAFNDVFIQEGEPGRLSRSSAEAAAGPQTDGEVAGTTRCSPEYGEGSKVTCWCVDPTWCCSKC